MNTELTLILNELKGALGNIIVFFLVPLIWWLIRHRKKENFFKFLGFYKPKIEVKWWIFVLFVVLYIIFQKLDFTIFIPESEFAAVSDNENISANAFAGIGLLAIIPGLIQNFVANGICEEVLFRGFIVKRFAHHFGKLPGIIIGAVLFGLMHNTLYLLAGIEVGFIFHLVMFIFTGMAGFLLGFLNEKIYNGSIWPSVIVHGLVDFIGTIEAAFLINI